MARPQSVVIELQRDALDRAVPVSDLLRKAFVVARKLHLADLHSWIELELNGYGDRECPSYRVIRGQVRAFNPYRGWQPVVFESPSEEELLSKRPCGQSIAELEDLLRRKHTSGAFHMPYPHELQQKISRGFGLRGFQTEVSLFATPQDIVRIVDAVRTIVLNWALKLEEDGVLGEGLSFTPGEKEAASRGPQSINNFFGPVHNAQIQQGSDRSLQVGGAIDTEAVAALLKLVRGQLDQVNLRDEGRHELEAELRTVEAQVNSPNPKVPIIREGLHSIRSILEKAGGSAVGQLLVELGKLIL